MKFVMTAFSESERRTALRHARSWLRIYGAPAALLALAIWAGSNVAATIHRIVAFYTPVPVWDYWRVVQNLPQYEAHHWSVLWTQHNEHRIIFPEIIFAVDALYLHMRQTLPLVLSFLTYAGTFLVLSWPVLRDRQLLLWQRGAIVLLAATVVFWESCALALLVPFLLQWPLMQFATALSFLALAELRAGLRPGWLIALCAAGTVATYTSGNALLLWPLLLIYALLSGIEMRCVVVLAFAATANIGLYFVGYHRTSSLDIAGVLKNPLRTLNFTATYLSMPFGGMDQPSPLLFGYGLLAGLIVSALIAWRRRWLATPTVLVLTGTMGFALLTAAMTAAGRMTADPTYGGAKAGRYLTMAQMNWGAGVLLVLWIAARCDRRAALVGSALIAAFSAHYLQRLRPWLAINSERPAETLLAALSLEDDQLDPQLARDYIYPDLPFVESMLPKLQASKLSYFAHGHQQWIGKPITQYAPLEPPLNGAILQAFTTQSGVQVVGWVADAELRQRVRWVILADESGIVRGFAQRFSREFPSSAEVSRLPTPFGWVGYVSPAMAGKRIKAYAVDERKPGLLPIEDSFRVSNLMAVALSTKVPLTARLPWHLEPQGTPNWLPSGLDIQDAPAAKAYSTWAGSDALTGEVYSGNFARPANGCVVVPVLTGPRVGPLSASLEDAATGKAIEQIPLRNDRSGSWTYWQVRVKDTESQLRIHMSDGGTSWGEWLATSDPLQCR